LRAGQEDLSNPNNRPICEIKQKFESLIKSWKKAMEKTEFIVKYINHLYDDVNNDSYILMEYCPGGNLRKEILKKKNENKKFS
jgi:serine/threonine protein kinase